METHRYLWLAMAGLGFAAGFAIPRGGAKKEISPADEILAGRVARETAEQGAGAPVSAPSAPLPVRG